MHEGVEHNDELQGKLRRVEQLDYKMDKMLDQAQLDRDLIEALKETVKEK